MLNIGRMAPGSQRYYLDAVARGVEDYYLGHGEAPGRWLGDGAAGLGLDGPVTGEQLSRVLAGQHPATGETLAGHPARKVPGFDLTFRAPKSVSLLWALTDEQVSGQVQAAHDAAVDAAVGYLQRAAGRTRRGAGGVERVGIDGFVAAGFRHRTSRANDPLLHTHVLVANLARTSDDGVWRTLDSRLLFVHAKTAGTLYQAHLRDQLTRRLGVAWQPVVNGHADLAGVDRAFIDAFSKRRRQILTVLDQRGEASAKAAQVATLDTRQAKTVLPDELDLKARWRSEAARHGIDDGWWRPLLGRRTQAPPDLAGLQQTLVQDEGLTAQRSTFTLRDAVRTVAEQLPNGAPVAVIEQTAGRLVSDGLGSSQVVELGPPHGRLVEVIRRDDGTVVPATAGEARFTTRGLLLLEQAAVTAAVDRQHDTIAQVTDRVVGRAVGRRPSMTDEQAAMVHRLTRFGAGVDVVVGKAGTGKTFALDAAREAWQAAGIRVTGVTLAARAGLELQEAAGIPTTTLARLERRLDRPDPDTSPLQAGQVLVVDEAGMIATRPLARLLRHCQRQHVKVVLVGDPHQLPEIDAGGLFRALTHRLPVVELTTNRRQTHPWEAAALDQLRHGRVPEAIDAYRTHGRIFAGQTAEEIRERLVADWWHAHDRHAPGQAVMIALRKTDVDDLNARARARLAATGLIHGPTLTVNGRDFQAGDRIVCLHNDRQLGVVNGTRATVLDVDPDRHLVRAITDDQLPLRLPARYIDSGSITHGYAVTGHKAQGLTVDHTFVLGSPALYREWGYVALSRGRHTNRLYLHQQHLDQLDLDHHGRQPPTDPIVDATRQLSRSHAHTPLTATRPTVDLATLADQWQTTATFLASPDVRRQPHVHAEHAAKTRERDAVLARLDDLHHQAARQHGPAITRRTRQQRAWLDTETARQTDRLHDLDHDLDRLDRLIARLPTDDQIARARTRHDQLTQTLRDHARDRVAAIETDPPRYLTATIGSPPANPDARRRWRNTATIIENYRIRWNITHPTLPLGHPPTGDLQHTDHANTLHALHMHTRPPERNLDRTRGLAR